MIDSQGRVWETGFRESDWSQLFMPSPTDKNLEELSPMMVAGYAECVLLRHRISGLHFARWIGTNQMVKVYLCES